MEKQASDRMLPSKSPTPFENEAKGDAKTAALLDGRVNSERRSKQTHLDARAGKAGIISHLVCAALDAVKCFFELTNKPSTPQRDKNILQRCHSMLTLWADGHGVRTGRLDDVLSRSQNLQATTLSVLIPMCKVLLHEIQRAAPPSPEDTSLDDFCITFAEIYGQAKSLLIGLEMGTSESDSDSDSDSDASQDDLKETRTNNTIDDIKMYTNCLVDLGVALECPAVDPKHVHETTPRGLEPREAHDFYTRLIRDKFLGVSPSLAECLGKANWGRYQRMQREREINANGLGSADDQAKSHSAGSEFQDSGLGTSVPPAPSSYAETIISFMTSVGGGNRVPIPPLPTEAKNGIPFECNACGKFVRATTNRDWRKHLFLDIQPYTCLYGGCAFVMAPFANRQLWSTHLETEHKFGPDWRSVECPLCREVTANGKSAILIHFARHMEDIALAALPRGVEEEAQSETESQSGSEAESGMYLGALDALDALDDSEFLDTLKQYGTETEPEIQERTLAQGLKDELRESKNKVNHEVESSDNDYALTRNRPRKLRVSLIDIMSQ